jgi:prephenate dehydrogenase
VRWNKVTLVGVGLLGGSLGLALRERKLAQQVVGYVRRIATQRLCRKTGATDSATQNLEKAVAGADLVVLCTPLGQMRGLTEQFSKKLAPGTIVTDVGSVKGSVVRELEKLVSRAGGHFVGSHPMAGSEKTGVEAARANLFAGNVCVVTPTKTTNHEALRKVLALWKDVGASVLSCSPEIHDSLVSYSSHLPHVIAAALVNLVLNPRRGKNQATLCANGFRDSTRIAAGSPEMWRDIALANRRELVCSLRDFRRHLEQLEKALISGRVGTVDRFFQQAKEKRERLGTHNPARAAE